MLTQWSLKYKACIDCKRTSVRHAAKGRCQACKTKFQWHNNPKRRKKMEQAQAKWRKANPEKFNAICYRANKKFKLKHEGLA